MRVLKITAEGITTSFRYPHFMLGVQPTYEMPPPATIYGHIASALGEWFNPKGVAFAYHFTYKAKFDDVEHVHVLHKSSGKIPNTNMPKVLEGAVNPYKRVVLFQPKLTLYLNKPEWEDAFFSPRYPVVLGRSQDLFTYIDVQIVELKQVEQAYFEHTIAPFDFTMKTAQGYTVLMPRFLDYEKYRQPYFERYVVINRRVCTTDLLRMENAESQYWADLSTPEDKNMNLGLLFHTFVGG